MTNYSLSPIWGAGAQLLTNNATPLSGGKIYVYAAGTTTPATTYTGPTGMVPNTNPIILDAAGRPPNEIWFPVGSTFKFVLKTSADVLIATYDNIPSVPQPPFTNSANGISYSTPYLVNAGSFSTGVTYTIASVGNTDFTAIGAVSNTVGVVFTASGAGSGTGNAYYTRTVQAKLQETVSVKDYGAVGDGSNDDTAAIQAALTGIAFTGGTLLFPPGTYKITSTITQAFADGVNVNIVGYGAKIDMTSISTYNARVITLGGSRGASTTLSSSATKNADTFAVTSAANISAGRVLLITSTSLWNPTRPYYYSGELALVEKVFGTTITNSNFLYDNYSSADTSIYTLNMPYITVEGLEFEANANLTALNITYARNPTVRNCVIHGARYAGVEINYYLGGVVDSNYIYDAWNGLVTGTSYGVAVGSGQGCKVTNNTIYNARHAITSGGTEPAREVIYANNTCHSSTQENLTAALDLHGNTEFCSILNNIASNIVCSGINAIIANNQLDSAETNVPGITLFQEINSDYYVIQNNVILAAGATAQGVWLSPSQDNISVTKLTFSGNTVKSVGAGFLIQPRNSGVTGCSTETLVMSENVISVTGNNRAFTLSNSGAATYAVTDLFSSNNVYESTYDAFVTSDTVTFTKSTGDVFKSNRSSGYIAYFGGVDVHLTAPVFRANTGGAGAARSVFYNNTGRVDVINPIYSDLTYKAELFSPTVFAENGWYSATPTILNTAGAKLVNFYGTLGRAITYGTAAPTTNTWAVGDRVYNQAPAAGQPKSWVCTVAGTPGTWVSEGNL